MTVLVMRRVLLAMAALCVATMMDTPASAQGETTGLIGRAWIGTVGRYVLKDNGTFTPAGFGTSEMMVDGSGLGLGGDIEYKFSKWLGVDGALGYSNLKVDYTSSLMAGTQQQRFKVVPLLFALDIHFVHTAKVDLWAGPQVGWVMFPTTLSFPVAGAGTFTYQPQNSFSKKGFVFGADIGMTKTAAFNFAVRWQNADGDPDGNLTVDPTFVTFGVTKKF